MSDPHPDAGPAFASPRRPRCSRSRRLTGWLAPWLVAAGLTVLGGCTVVDRAEPDLALADVVAGAGPSLLKAMTPVPERQAIAYRVDGRQHRGDLYLSPEGSLAGLVLVPGVVPAGKDDPRLVALANTLARLRFAVLVPDMRGLRAYRVRAGDVDEVADAFRHLLSEPAWAPQGRAGIAGFSYGAGPVLLAGLRPDIRERVDFMVALGGYYDLAGLITYFTTGYYRAAADAPWQYREPSPYAAWVFARSNAGLLEHPADRAWLAEHVQGLRESGEADAEPPLLGSDARALVALLRNRDPERVPALLAAQSPRIRAELRGINPAAHDLSRLRAQLILVHGRADNIIPHTESEALARAVPPTQVQLFLIEGFAHVDVRPTGQDVPQLRRAMTALLARRASVRP